MKKSFFSAVLLLLLIIMTTVAHAQSDSKKECACDTTAKDYLLVSKFNPEPSITSAQFEDILNKSLPVNDEAELSGKSFAVSFIINCKGEGCAYEAMRPSDPAIERGIVECLRDNVQWTVGFIEFGKGEKRPVDFSKTIVVKFELGKGFKLLSPLEISELNSKKKKK